MEPAGLPARVTRGRFTQPMISGPEPWPGPSVAPLPALAGPRSANRVVTWIVSWSREVVAVPGGPGGQAHHTRVARQDLGDETRGRRGRQRTPGDAPAGRFQGLAPAIAAPPCRRPRRDSWSDSGSSRRCPRSPRSPADPSRRGRRPASRGLRCTASAGPHRRATARAGKIECTRRREREGGTAPAAHRHRRREPGGSALRRHSQVCILRSSCTG